MEFDEVDVPYWDDKPLLLVGNGPSLGQYDISDLRSLGRVVLMNDAVHSCKGHVLISMDNNWMRRSPVELACFEGEEIFLVVGRHSLKRMAEGLTPIRYLEKYASRETVLSKEKSSLFCAGNSGFAALNLAMHKKAREVYLLGYDMNPGGHAQWHSVEEELGLSKRMNYAHYYTDWPSHFEVVAEELKSKMRITNLNPNSGLRCFKMGRYEDIGLMPTSNS